MKKTLLALALPFAFATAAHAQTGSGDIAEPFRFMVGIGLTVGGSNVATAQYTDNTTNNVSAGTGVQLMVGADYRITEHFSMQASVGYRGRFALGSNGDLSFNRYPVELLAYYNINNRWRIGGGMQYIANPSLSGTGVAAQYDQDYKATVGAIFEVEFFPTERLGVKFRAVKETYKPATPYNYSVNNPGESIDGSHVGVLSSYYF